MTEPKSEAMALATALVGIATDLEAGRSPTVDPATFRRAGDLLAAKPSSEAPSALDGLGQGGRYWRERAEFWREQAVALGWREVRDGANGEATEPRKAREAREANDGR